jgi:hypothetical protein
MKTVHRAWTIHHLLLAASEGTFAAQDEGASIMAHLAVSFNEKLKWIEVKIIIPKVISIVLIDIYAWRRRRSGRPPFGGEDFLLSPRGRQDIGLPDRPSMRDRVMMRHPARF